MLLVKIIMFKSIALATTAALISAPTTTNAAHDNSTGTCYSTFNNDKAYTVGSLISYATITNYCCAVSGTAGTETVGCNKGDANCVCTVEGQFGCGAKRMNSETINNNWKCTTVSWCNDENWQPGNSYGGNAWTKKEVCTVSLLYFYCSICVVLVSEAASPSSINCPPSHINI